MAATGGLLDRNIAASFLAMRGHIIDNNNDQTYKFIRNKLNRLTWFKAKASLITEEKKLMAFHNPQISYTWCSLESSVTKENINIT